MSAGRNSGQGRHRLHRNKRAQRRTAGRPTLDTSRAVSRGLLIPSQQRTAGVSLHGYSRFIGRVGALAVALGVGVGFTTSMPGIAWADDTDSSSSTDSSSPSSPSAQSDTTTATDTTTTTSTSSDAPSNTSGGDAPAADPATGTVQSSGGAQTGSYGPNATTPASDDDEPATETTTSEVPAETESTNSTPTDAPATPTLPLTPQTPAPQDDSTTSTDPSAQMPPGNTAVDPDSAGNPSDVNVPDNPTASGTVAGLGDPANTRLFTTSSPDDGTADNGSRMFTAFSTQDNSALTQDTSLTTTQDPMQTLMAIPATVVNIAAGFVTALLSPFLTPGPVTPTPAPLTLFAVLDWVRREIQRTFFNRSPNAVADIYTTSEDVGFSGNVLTNDTDADGDALKATLVNGPAHGDVTLNPDGSFTYTPDANYNGTDTFTYQISDETSGWHLHGLAGLLGAGHTDTTTVTINLTAQDETLTVMTRNIYLGGNLLPLLTATSQDALVAAMTNFYDEVQATNFHERAEALADEIAAAEPHLVGLQEARLFLSQTPADNSATPNATDVEYDFVQILLDALAARGQHYAVVSTITTTDREAPHSTPDGLQDIRFTDREVILARTDLPATEFSVANAQSGLFVSKLVLPHAVLGSVSIPRGWVSVDATVSGTTVRFVSTHLERIGVVFQTAQAAELLAGPLNTTLPVVVVGDFNSAAGGVGGVPGQSLTPTYATMLAAGFTDTWTATHGSDSGFTCCQAPNLRNDSSTLSERIDFVFERGILTAIAADLVGENPDDRTPSGLWPSDHAGQWTRLSVPED